MEQTAERQVLTVSEAAARLRVTGETVRKWIRDGTLPAGKLINSRVGYRIKVDDVERLLSGELT